MSYEVKKTTYLGSYLPSGLSGTIFQFSTPGLTGRGAFGELSVFGVSPLGAPAVPGLVVNALRNAGRSSPEAGWKAGGKVWFRFWIPTSELITVATPAYAETMKAQLGAAARQLRARFVLADGTSVGEPQSAAPTPTAAPPGAPATAPPAPRAPPRTRSGGPPTPTDPVVFQPEDNASSPFDVLGQVPWWAYGIGGLAVAFAGYEFVVRPRLAKGAARVKTATAKTAKRLSAARAAYRSAA